MPVGDDPGHASSAPGGQEGEAAAAAWPEVARRELPRLAGAAAASVALGAVPLPDGDPFRSTLIVVPWVAGGLAAVGRRLGRRSRVPAVGLAGWAALGLLLLLIVGRAHVGLGPAVAVDRLLAAGLLLLLAGRVARLLPPMRRALGRRLPDRPPVAFFLVPLLVYLAIAPWSTGQRPPDGDEPYYLLIAHSVAYDFDTELNNNYAAGDSLRFVPRELAPEWADPRGAGGELYSRHNVLLPLLLAAPYRLAGKWGALAVMALLAAATAWMTLRVARHHWRDRPVGALSAWALVALTPPFLLYSVQVWVEVPGALLLLLAVDSLYGLAAGGSARQGLALAASLVLLPLLKLRLLLLAAGLLALAWWRARGARRTLATVALLLGVAAAAILYYNFDTFGRALKDHSWQQVSGLQQRPPVEYLRGAVGLLFDNAFGLFATAPVWWLAVPGAIALAVRRHPLFVDLLLCSLPYLAVVSPRMEWYGAWSPPFRLGLVLLPLLGLAAVPLLDRRKGLDRQVLQALAAVTAALSLLWLTVPGWTYNLADGSSHLLGHLAERLAADVGRLFPSFVRSGPATWWWPAVSLLLAGGLWWLPRKVGGRRSLGVVAALLAAAAVPAVASRLPSRVIELEDRQVRKSGGTLYPDAWVPARPRFPGGWTLLPGATVSAPVVAGRGRLHLDLDLRFNGPADRPLPLEVRAGDALLASTSLSTAPGWQTVSLELGRWPADSRLVIGTPAHREAGAAGVWALVLDRARLRWEE